MPHRDTQDGKVATEVWSFETGDDIDASPAVVDGTVYVGSNDGTLYAVNAATGTEEWTFEPEDQRISSNFVSSPAVWDGTVYVVAGGNLYGVNAATGTTLNSFNGNDLKVGYGFNSSPTVVDGIVYVGGYDKLYAVDATEGTTEWKFETGDMIKSSPTVSDGTVYVGSNDENLYAVDTASGTKEWVFETGGAVRSSPTVWNGTVYAGSGDSNLYAIDAVSGSKDWAFGAKNGIYSSPTVMANRVYVGSDDDTLYAVDAVTGSEEWTFDTGSRDFHFNAFLSSPMVANGTVYIGSNNNHLYAVDADTGTKEWAFETGSWVRSSPVVNDGVVYVGCDDNTLYAVSASATSEGAKKKQSVSSSPTSNVSPLTDTSKSYSIEIETGTELIPSLEEVGSPERRTLSPEDFETIEDLGRGGQAVIKKVRLPDNKAPPEVVAIREPMRPTRSIAREDFMEFLDHAETWETIDDCERTKPHRWGTYEHIVGVIDIGEEFPWIALEYMDGGDLEDLLGQHPDGLPIGQALWIGECVCKGLEIAHELGKSHLDVKPENVLLTQTDGWPWPKLADWGLARTLAEQSGSMDGYTPEYAAPEQFDSGKFGDPDQLTDMYQTGALVHALLTGKPPATGGHYEIIKKVTEGTIPAPSQRRSQLPPAIDAAVGVALEQQKTERYDSIVEFRKALTAIRTNEKLPPAVATRL